MALSALILSLIGVILGLISILISFININAQLNNKNTHTENTPKQEYSEDMQRGIDIGKDAMLNALILTVFDMYRQSEILDYDTQINDIMKRMNMMMENDDYRAEVISELESYRKEGLNGLDNN